MKVYHHEKKVYHHGKETNNLNPEWIPVSAVSEDAEIFLDCVRGGIFPTVSPHPFIPSSRPLFT